MDGDKTRASDWETVEGSEQFGQEVHLGVLMAGRSEGRNADGAAHVQLSPQQVSHDLPSTWTDHFYSVDPFDLVPKILIPVQAVVEENLSLVADAQWRQDFLTIYRRGLRAELWERRWKEGEAQYLACWQMLEDALLWVEPYSWLCMLVGTRLIWLYLHELRNLPKCLVVMAWLREVMPFCWQLLLHRREVLVQRGLEEKQAGDLEDAHKLEMRATMRKGAWASVAEEEQEGDVTSLPDEFTSCPHGLSWCTCATEGMDRMELILIADSHLACRRPLSTYRVVEEFYDTTDGCVGTPVMPPPNVLREKLQLVKGGDWQAQFADALHAALGMEDEQLWSLAVTNYLKCKHMIERRFPVLILPGIYEWLSMLIGTRIACLYQVKLGKLEDCVAILDWLLDLVEPQSISPLLMMHRAAVLYQWSCYVVEKEGDAVRAEHLLQKAMEVQQVIGVAVQPGPDHKVFFCLSLASIFTHQGQKWLDKAFGEHIGMQPLHSAWQMFLEWEQVYQYFGAWEEFLQALLAFRAHLEEPEILQALRARFMPRTMIHLLHCIQNVNRKGDERGVWWTADELATSAQRLVQIDTELCRKGLESLVQDLEQELEQEVEEAALDVTDISLDRVESLYQTYNLMRIYTTLGEEKAVYVKKQIFLANKMLERLQTLHKTSRILSSILHWQYLVCQCHLRAGGLADNSLLYTCNNLQCWLNDYAEARTHYEAAFDLFLQITGSIRVTDSLLTVTDRQKCGFKALCGLFRLQAYHVLRIGGRISGLSAQKAAVSLNLPDGECDLIDCDPDKLATELESHIQVCLQAWEKCKVFWTQWTLDQWGCLSEYEFLQFLEAREAVCPWTAHFTLKTEIFRKLLWNCSHRMSTEFESYMSFSMVELVSYVERRHHAFLVYQCGRTLTDIEELQTDDTKLWNNVIFDCQNFCSTPASQSVLVLYHFEPMHSTSSLGLLYIFIIHKGADQGSLPMSVQYHKDVDMEEIDKILEGFHTPSSSLHEDGNQHLVDHGLRRLYDILVKPISHILNGMHIQDKVIFVGGKYFIGVPFAILRNSTTEKYLFQEHTTSVTSSFLALRHCQKRLCDLQSHPIVEAALAVADPAYGTTRNAMKRLAGTASEVTSIQHIFMEDKIKVITMEGTTANVQSFLEEVERPGRRPFIHLAVHGGTVRRRLTHPTGTVMGEIKQGAVFLADPKVKTWPPRSKEKSTRRHKVEDFLSESGQETELIEVVPPKDVRSTKQALIPGTLAADDILKRAIPWNAGMVFLSACESARGQVLGTGGLLNLPHALMLSGVPCVVASQWKVPDETSTPQLIKQFYQGVKEGLDVSSALRLAMENMLVHEPHNVLQWGAFSVWGLPTICVGNTTTNFESL